MKSVTITSRGGTLPLKVYLSVPIMAKMNLELASITNTDGKLPHGVKSQLIEGLLEQWLEQRKAERAAETATATPEEEPPK